MLPAKTDTHLLSGIRYGRQNSAKAGGGKTVRKFDRNVAEGEEGGKKYPGPRCRARNLAKEGKIPENESQIGN